MADYCPAGPRLESRIGIEDFYGSCRRATVVIVEQNEGAVETRKELTNLFSIRHANGGRVVRGCPNVIETTRTENGALAAVVMTAEAMKLFEPDR